MTERRRRKQISKDDDVMSEGESQEADQLSVDSDCSFDDEFVEMSEFDSAEDENFEDEKNDSESTPQEGESGPCHEQRSNSDDDRLLRESGDGKSDNDQEAKVNQKLLKIAEDRNSPLFIPTKGNFYQHDVRSASSQKSHRGGRIVHSDMGKDRWLHDKYDEGEQTSKTQDELIEEYGYDIRSKGRSNLATRRSGRRPARQQGVPRSRQMHFQRNENEEIYSTTDNPRHSLRGRGSMRSRNFHARRNQPPPRSGLKQPALREKVSKDLSNSGNPDESSPIRGSNKTDGKDDHSSADNMASILDVIKEQERARSMTGQRGSRGKPPDSFRKSHEEFQKSREDLEKPKDNFGKPQGAFVNSKDSLAKPRDDFGRSTADSGMPRENFRKLRKDFRKPHDRPMNYEISKMKNLSINKESNQPKRYSSLRQRATETPASSFHQSSSPVHRSTHSPKVPSEWSTNPSADDAHSSGVEQSQATTQSVGTSSCDSPKPINYSPIPSGSVPYSSSTLPPPAEPLDRLALQRMMLPHLPGSKLETAGPSLAQLQYYEAALAYQQAANAAMLSSQSLLTPPSNFVPHPAPPHENRQSMSDSALLFNTDTASPPQINPLPQPQADMVSLASMVLPPPIPHELHANNFPQRIAERNVLPPAMQPPFPPSANLMGQQVGGVTYYSNPLQHVQVPGGGPMDSPVSRLNSAIPIRYPIE